MDFDQFRTRIVLNSFKLVLQLVLPNSRPVHQGEVHSHWVSQLGAMPCRSSPSCTACSAVPDAAWAPVAACGCSTQRRASGMRPSWSPAAVHRQTTRGSGKTGATVACGIEQTKETNQATGRLDGPHCFFF